MSLQQKPKKPKPKPKPQVKRIPSYEDYAKTHYKQCFETEYQSLKNIYLSEGVDPRRYKYLNLEIKIDAKKAAEARLRNSYNRRYVEAAMVSFRQSLSEMQKEVNTMKPTPEAEPSQKEKWKRWILSPPGIMLSVCAGLLFLILLIVIIK